MDFTLFDASWPTILMVILSTIGIYIALLLLKLGAGLRSFSKMSGFDFVVTIAIGSMIANTIVTKEPTLIIAITAFVTLFVLQAIVARLRFKQAKLIKYTDSVPLLLMDGPMILEKNMKKVHITTDELYTSLREANVTQLSQVKAVVMERTGGLSVLHHPDPYMKLDIELLEDVRK